MSDSLPVVGGTLIVDINPNAFAPATKVDGTALDATNTTPVLTPVGASPIYKDNQFSGPRPSIRVDGTQGFKIPRPVQDDWTIFLVVKNLQGYNADPNWYRNAALVDAEMPFSVDDFGLTMRADGKLTPGIGNPDTTGTGTIDARGRAPRVIAFKRIKSTGQTRVYVDGTLDSTIIGNTNSLTAPPSLWFGISNSDGHLKGDYGRIAIYDTALSDSDRATIEGALATMYSDPPTLYSTKIVAYTPIGLPGSLRATKFNVYSALGGSNLSSSKVVFYTVIGPPPPGAPPTTSGPPPVVLPPEPCTDSEQPEGCCVPEVNGLIETRVGPLNTLEDIRKAIWYLQDRQNVMVREWNKLAAVTRTNFPRV